MNQRVTEFGNRLHGIKDQEKFKTRDFCGVDIIRKKGGDVKIRSLKNYSGKKSLRRRRNKRKNCKSRKCR